MTDKVQSKNKIKHKQNQINTQPNFSNPLKKEFQLLYRTRDHLPSQQAYQSLIFMKSKKCPQSTSRTKFNTKNTTTNQLRIMIKNLQKKIKLQQKQQQKITTKTSKFMTSYPLSEQRDSTSDGIRKKRILKKSKSPLKTQNKTKRQVDSSRKHNLKVKVPIPTSQDYILIGQHFVSLSQSSISQLQAKISQFYNFHNCKSTQQFESDVILKNQCKQSQQQIEQTQIYINRQIIKIQRWWRKLKQKNNNQINSHNSISQDKSIKIVYAGGDIQEMALNVLDKLKSVNQIINQKENTIPSNNLKFIQNNINHLGTQKINDIDDALKLRENAANLQFNTHKSILDKLLENKKIKTDTYALKIKQIQDNLQNELQQIFQIKQLLKNKFNIEHNGYKNIQDINLNDSQQQITQELLNKLLKIQYNNQGRQKSTGCHYNPASVRHFFSRQTPQEFSQQSGDDDDDQKKIDETQQAEYYNENHILPNDFMANANFHQLIQQYKERQIVKNQIQRRLAIQMGIIVPILDNTSDINLRINTSISGIHNFLVTFFKFYTYYYKDQFLRFINMPYGYSPQKRLAYMQSYDEQFIEDDEDIAYGIQNVIGQQILQDFHQNFYEQKQQGEESESLKFQYQKIHNKAVFDAFNQGLNYFRPYYLINGPPYIWNNCQKALTFYFIAEENIREVFEKTQFKVLKWASSLCGVIMSNYDRTSNYAKQRTLQQTISQYRQCTHSVVVENRQQKLFKSQKMDVQQFNYTWFLFQQQRTALLYEISALVLEQIVKQLHEQQLFKISISLRSSYFEQSNQYSK